MSKGRDESEPMLATRSPGELRLPLATPASPTHPARAARITSCVIDNVALAALRTTREQPEPTLTCHLCEATITGVPTSTGMFMWMRGDETRFEEPPLCARCSATLVLTTMYRWERM